MIQLHRAIYASRAVGVSSSNLMALSEILGASQRNNVSRGLTGMLLAHDGWFLQVLEGQKASIDRLFADLEGDSRHVEIRMLSYDLIDQAEFSQWSMGQAVITPAIADQLKGKSLPHLSAEEALSLLRACADELKSAG